ncbi:MAG: aminopeptidase P family protein [Chloroflexi bacterium]|nr:aminopeptidase P family protein [Chloroflexota bacterium]
MHQPPTVSQSERGNRFSDAEFGRRHAAVRAMMAERGLDVLISHATSAMPANLRYLAGWGPYGNGPAFLLFPASGAPLLLVGIFSHVASAQRAAVVPAEFAGPDSGVTLAERLQDLGLARARIGLVEVDSARNRGMPSVILDELGQRLPEATFEFATQAVELVRRFKSDEEVAVLERAAGMAEQALEAMVAAARPGNTEWDLAAAVYGAAARAGGTVEVALLGSTSMEHPSMATPRTQPTMRRLERGDVILSELSVGYLGYSTQLLRPITIGQPNDLYRRLIDIAIEVYRSVQAILQPGATERDVQAAAKALAQPGIAAEAPIVHGWSQWSEFGFHITMPGDEAHWPSRPVRFDTGMSMSIEPNPCTADFRAGVFMGDLNVITPTGARTLHRWPLEPIVV